MIWYISEESKYYNPDNRYELIGAVCSKYQYDMDYLSSAIEYLYVNPGRDEIREIINKHSKELNKVSIVSPVHPSYYNFANIGFFTSIEVPNIDFPFTEEQKNMNYPIDKLLSIKGGVRIVKTEKTLENDMAVGEVLLNDVNKMVSLEKIGRFVISGLFFFGVAGSGKTHFAECFAGSTGRLLVILDLPYFMSLPNPTAALNKTLDFLLMQKDRKFLLLVDEIEKMFQFDNSSGSLKAKNVFGALLTRLSQLYGKVDTNITFLATSNDITPIAENNPEFLRKGRFNRLYFMNYPLKESAISVFDLYVSKNKKKIAKFIMTMLSDKKKRKDAPLIKPFIEAIEKKEITAIQLVEYLHFDFNTKKLVELIDEFYYEVKQSGKNFVYVPPEIQAFCEEAQDEYEYMLFSQKDKYGEPLITIERIKQGQKAKPFDAFVYDFGYVEKIASTNVPLQVFASKGVSKQLAQAKNYQKESRIQQFIEVS